VYRYKEVPITPFTPLILLDFPREEGDIPHITHYKEGAATTRARWDEARWDGRIPYRSE
jgi:hypothetical protein